MPKKIEAVILDIGEVLIRLDFSVLLKALDVPANTGLSDALRRMDAWEIYDKFERGHVTEEEFFLPKPALKKVWNLVLTEAVEGLENLLATVSKNARLFALTNTNCTHLQHAKAHYPFLKSFERIFSSYEIGHRKPESEIYAKVAAEIKLPPENLLFIDDRLENVEGARKSGWKAEHCKTSPADLVAILKNYKVLPQDFS